MKKIIAVIFLQCICAACGNTGGDTSFSLKDLEFRKLEAVVDFKHPQQVIKDSSLVIEGDVLDEITTDNSTVKYNTKSKSEIEDFYSIRRIKLHKVLKGDKSLENKEIEVTEPIAIVNDKVFTIYDSLNTSLNKGDSYILFLDKSTDPKAYSILSGGYSKVNLKQDNYNPDKITEFKDIILLKYASSLNQAIKDVIEKAENY